MQSTNETLESGVKNEPSSPQGFTMGLLSETPEPVKHIGCAYVRQVISEQTTGNLEPIAILAKESLKKLVEPRAKVVGSSDARRTIRNIEEIQKRKMRVRSLIGVVGGTGAGKSSLINTLLGEERLLPTFGNDACTAAVTEISYNDSVQPDEKYKAEGELITEEEWRKEMNELIEDIKSLANGDDSDDSDDSEKAEAEIALAKIQSVYPHLDKEALTRGKASNLICNETLRGILGNTKKFKVDSPEKLYEQIRPYMDSSSTSTENICRRRTASRIVASDQSCQDLPSCGDTNAARVAVAAKYIERCTSIFVVAPIKRAVNDKLAQNLLGESFKLQMKLNGHYANMTFVCWITDEVNMKEAAANVGLGKAHEDNETAIENTNAIIASEEAERQNLEADISNKKAEKKRLSKQMAQYKELQVQAAEGKSVVAPTPSGKKRKSTSAQNQPAKKQRGSTGTCPSPIDSDSDKDGDETNDNGPAKSLTVADIQSILGELKKEKDAISQDIKAKIYRCHELHGRKITLRNPLEEKRVHLRSECIKRRNDDSRSKIKRDFIHGHKELGSKTSTQARSKGYAKKKAVHIHDAIGEQLSVYCVSSRQYQILCGRCTEKRDGGFATPEDTEIPQLLEHTKNSAGIGTTRNCKNILNGSAQVLEFLQSWTTPKANEDILSEDDVNLEEEYLNQDIKKLTEDLMKIVTDSTNECKNIMNRNLFIQFKPAINKVAKQLPDIVRNWVEEKVDDSRYRYPSGTYKATLRRHGTQVNHCANLAFPLKENIANDWERTFVHQLPEVLDKFCADIEHHMMTFHDVQRSRLSGTAVATRVDLLESQLRDYHIQGIKTHQDTFRSDIIKKQREINRMLTPIFKEEMYTTYEKCAKQKGRGAIHKMRNAIKVQAGRHGKNMVTAVAKRVEDSLKEMTDDYTKEMVVMVENTLDSLTSDYRSCITKCDEPVAPLRVRREILRIISEIDEDFRHKFLSAPEEDTSATAAMNIDNGSGIADQAMGGTDT